MQGLISDLLHSTSSSNETFQGFNHIGGTQNSTKKHAWIGILSFILVEILLLIFGKYLWNEVAIKLFNGLRKIRSIWEILGLSILIKLLTN